MQTLNILSIGRLPPWHPKVGGGDVIAFKLSEALAKMGHNITYLAVADESFRREVAWADFKYISKDENFSSLSLVADDFNIIHIHNIFGLGFKTYKRLRKDRKCVVGLYAPLAHRIPRSFDEILYTYLCKNADMVFSLSEFSKKNIADAYGIRLNKIKVMHAGVDETFFICKNTASLPLKPLQYKDPLTNLKSSKWSARLLFCGCLNGKEQKGVDILLKALPLILKEHDIILDIIGDGPRLEQYKDLARRLEIEGSVIFRGFIEHDQMPVEYSKADIFVFPSRRESFGLVLAEAMATGLPVVSTRVGAIPEVVEDGKTGILVRSEDIHEFAEAVNFLLESPEKRSLMGLAGMERVKKYFTWEIVARNVIKFYKEIL